MSIVAYGITIYGVALEDDEVFDLLGITQEQLEDDEFDVDMALDAALASSDLTFSHPDYGDYYIGISWDEVGLDETGRQFQKRVKDQLKKVFGKNFKCSTHKHAWRY